MRTPRITSRRFCTGFTLVELMFVVVIMGIVTVSVIPAIDNVRTMRQGAARDGVAHMLTVAMGRASSTGRPHGLRVDLSDSTLTIVEINPLGTPATEPDPLTGKDRTLDLRTTYPGAGLSAMTNGDGTPGAGTIWFDFDAEPHTRDPAGSYISPNTEQATMTLTSGEQVVVYPYTGMVENR